MNKRNLLIVFFFMLNNTYFSVMCFIDIKKLIGEMTLTDSNVPFTFLTGLESRKKQREKLEEAIEIFKRQSAEANKSLLKDIADTEAMVESVRTQLKENENKADDHLARKITLFNEQNQVLQAIRELRHEREIILERHLKLVNNVIEMLGQDYTAFRAEEEQQRLYYTWKDYKEIQGKVAEISNKITTEIAKKETLHKERTVEKEKVSFLRKQFEVKLRERIKVLGKEQELVLLQQEVDLIQLKIAYANLKIETLDVETKFKEDEIQSYQYKLNDLKKKLPLVEKKLVLNIADVDYAKEELRHEIQKSLEVKDFLNKEREEKKKAREKVTLDLSLLKVQQDEQKDSNKEERPEILLLEAKISKCKNILSLFDAEITLLEAKKDLENIKVRRKEQQVSIIDIRYKLPRQEENIDEWLPDFINQKDLAASAIKLLKDKRNEAINLSIEQSRIVEALQSKKSTAEEKRNASKRLYQETIVVLTEAIGIAYTQQQLIQNYLTLNSDLIHLHSELIDQAEFIVNELESRKISLSLWKRSTKAISLEGLKQALIDAESFGKKFFWETPTRLSPFAVLSTLRFLRWHDYGALILFLLLFFAILFGIRRALEYLQERVRDVLSVPTEKSSILYWNILLAFLDFFNERYVLIFPWLLTFITLRFGGKHLPVSLYYFASSYFLTLFYLISIPVTVYIARYLLICIKILNQKLSFLFFTEKFQDKFIFLITVFLYSTAILLPLREAFISYSNVESDFPTVILAAYSLILVIVLLFFFNKEDVIKLLPSQNIFFIWLKKKIDKYYYPVFTFIMGLFILSNHYIGYSNLAWYLAFAVPSSVFIIYGMFFVHNYVRKYSAWFFIKEEDDQIIDKFEHAKTYYGFFVVFAFLFLLFCSFVFVTRIWGFHYTFVSVWKTLSQDLVIKDIWGTGNKLGVVELITLVIFMLSGFFISSLLNRFVLNKLFDIFRTEPGTQNTVTRITHYIIIFLSIILGFTAIKLGPLVAAISGFLILGVGFGLKDLVSDFFAGFWVLIERPIEIGHFIQTGDLIGTVQKIAVRATTIRTAQNYSVVVPNRELTSKPIINWGGGKYAVGFEMRFRVNYGASTDVVAKIIYEAAQAHPSVLRVPNVIIRLEEFGETSLNYFVRIFISSRKVREQWEIASDLRFVILRKFAENNITMPYQQTVIHFAGKDGEIIGPQSYQAKKNKQKTD